MVKVLLAVLGVVCVLGLMARQEGFLPYPAAPISIHLVDTTNTTGKGDYPGSASGPTPSSSSMSEHLQGFDGTNKGTGGCFEDTVIPTMNGENLRVLKCAQSQNDVPFFGPGAPSEGDTIWLLYWLKEPVSQGAGYTTLAHSAFASYGACWLAMRRLESENRAIFAENVDRAIRAHTEQPMYDSAPAYCKALKNSTANKP